MAKDNAYLKQLDAIVKQAAIEETFSLEVLNQIQALKTGFEDQAAEIERQKENTKTLNESLVEERKTNRDLSAKLIGWEEREADLTTREAEITKREADANKLQMQLDAAEQRVRDHKEMMQTVFRNPVVQRSVYESKSVPVTNSSGYPTMMTETNNHTETETIS